MQRAAAVAATVGRRHAEGYGASRPTRSEVLGGAERARAFRGAWRTPLPRPAFVAPSSPTSTRGPLVHHRKHPRKLGSKLTSLKVPWKVRISRGKARLLVDHGLDTLGMDYSTYLKRDMAAYLLLMKASKLSNSLRFLTRTYLGYEIQMGHQYPYEDCIATMRRYRRMKDQGHTRRGSDADEPAASADQAFPPMDLPSAAGAAPPVMPFAARTRWRHPVVGRGAAGPCSNEEERGRRGRVEGRGVEHGDRLAPRRRPGQERMSPGEDEEGWWGS